MRMRRKKNLDTRLDACTDLLMPFCTIGLDSREAILQKEYINYRELFGNDNPVELEIGCGKGGFICELAAREPGKNFLAVEKTRNVICTACETAQKMGLTNVRFLNIGAEYLEKYLPDHSIGRIYLNFSCPFPKSRYARHRLTHSRFLAIYEQLLSPGAEIHQKTDNMHLFEFSIEHLATYGYAIKNVSLDLHRSGFEGNIVTEYEQRFSSMGQPIYRLEAYLPDRGAREQADESLDEAL